MRQKSIIVSELRQILKSDEFLKPQFSWRYGKTLDDMYCQRMVQGEKPTYMTQTGGQKRPKKKS